MSPPSWRVELARLLPATRFDEPLAPYTTMRIGGPADAFVTVKTVDELRAFFGFAGKRRIPVFHFGWGSKLLIRDGGIRGAVLRLKGDFEKVEFGPGTLVRAGAGVRLPKLVMACAGRGLAGTEPLVGVPGTVGGALVMNAGTRAGEIGDIVRAVTVFDPRALGPARLTRSRLSFRYRASSLGKRLVLGVELDLKPGSKDVIIRRVEEFQKKRFETQPIHSFNVGSIFKNPAGHAAARLIESAGLKGRTSGGARISPRHANFIENAAGRARARDVLALVELARGAVRERTGIELELEMRVVGEESPRPA